MNTRIKTLQDALAYQLQGLLYTELRIGKAFSEDSCPIHAPEVKSMIKNYLENGTDVKLKFERIFNYIMTEPVPRKNDIIDRMIEETKHLLSCTSSPYLKDILMIGCVRNINSYKTASLQSCYLFTIELELDTAADLIQEILQWEHSICRQVNALSILELNKLNTELLRERECVLSR